MPRITIRVEPRGPVQEHDVEDAFLTDRPDIEIGNGLWAHFDRVDENGDYIYQEKMTLPKGGGA